MNTQTKNVDVVFYLVSCGTKPKELKALFLKAFHEGALVDVEEIDTLEVESIINNLSMGLDFNFEEATKRGFAILSSGNSIAASGRRKFSLAEKNRFVEIRLNHYQLWLSYLPL